MVDSTQTESDPAAQADETTSSNAGGGAPVPVDDAAPKGVVQPEILGEDDDVPDSLVGEFLLFLKEEKKFWLAPLVLVLLVLSAVIIFAEGSAIAPFIYTIF